MDNAWFSPSNRALLMIWSWNLHKERESSDIKHEVVSSRVSVVRHINFTCSAAEGELILDSLETVQYVTNR
jgi:hypothetical protein